MSTAAILFMLTFAFAVGFMTSLILIPVPKSVVQLLHLGEREIENARREVFNSMLQQHNAVVNNLERRIAGLELALKQKRATVGFHDEDAIPESNELCKGDKK